MAEENVIGLAMQLDVTDIKAGIKEVNNIIKSSKDEFNNATAGMDKWSKSSEGLTAKLSQLGKQFDAQEKAVAGYEAEIKRVSSLEGDHSTQLDALNKKLQKAQADVKKTQSQMAHYSDSLKTVSREEKEAGSALGKLTKEINDQQKELNDLTNDYKAAVLQYGKNSKEAKTLAAKIKEVSKSLDENKGKVESADKAFDKLGVSLQEVGEKALEKSVKGLAKVGAAVGGLVTAFLATAEGTREFRTNMGKVDTAFKDAGLSAKDAEETYKTFYGVLGDEGQATEATALLGELANNQQDLKKWTDISTGVFAKFGDSLPVEGLIEAANETAKTGEVVGSLADALNWAGISQDDFQDKLDKCSNEQERQKLITETLSKTYGDASSAYKETNKDIIASNEAQAQLSQTMADIGAKAEPLMTQVKLLGAKLLEAFLPVIETVLPAIENHLPLVVGIVGTLGGAVTALAAAVAIAKLQTDLATVATVAKTTAEKIAAGTTKALTLAQKGLNLAMKANTIGIVITVVMALVAAFVVLWKKSDAFRNFWIKLWDGVKKATKTTIDAIGKFFSACWDGIKKVWSFYKNFYSGVFKGIVNIFKALPGALKKFFSDAWNKAKDIWNKAGDFFGKVKDKVVNAFKNIPSSIKSFFSKAWDGVKNAWGNVGKFFSDIKDKVTGAFKDLPGKLKTVGTDLVKGLWNGIKDMTSWITGKLKGFSGDVLGGIKKFFKVNSPSKATAEIGGYLAEGLAEGLEDGADRVVTAGAKIGTGFSDTFTKTAAEGIDAAGNKIAGSFESLTSKIDRQKNKLSRLETQYKSIVLQFGETSAEAYAMGRQIITLSRELAANELKVKDLDDSYKNLSGTLANQMRIELNNAKNAQAALTEKQKEFYELMSQAGLKGDFSSVAMYGRSLESVNAELTETNIKIKELTDNLDYMQKLQEPPVVETAEEVVEAIEEEKNAYEKLQATIEAQKEALENLHTEYGSAIMQFGKGSAEAENLAEKIKKATAELEANEKIVSELDEAYKNLTATVEKTPDLEIEVKVDDVKGFKKFTDGFKNALQISDNQLEKWSEGAGEYFAVFAKIFDSITSKSMQFVEALNDRASKLAKNRIAEIEKELDALNALHDEQTKKVEDETTTEINAKKESTAEQLKQLDKLYDAQKISAEDYRKRKKQIEQELTNYTNAKNQEQLNTLKRINDEKAASEEKLLKEKDELLRKQFEARQKTAVAQAIIDGAAAIVKGYAELGPIAGSINAAAQAGITAAQIAAIKAEKYIPALAKGGIADGATLAMIGEAGKEAVLPLERNTGWIDTLAEKLNAIMQKDMLSGAQYMPAYAGMGGNRQITYNYQQVINAPKTPSRRELYRDGKNLLALKG